MAIGNRYKFNNIQRGGLIDIHRGAHIQQGSGWGSLFGTLFKRAIPAVSRLLTTGAKVAKKVATSKPAKELGQSMLKSGVEGVADIIAGEDPSKVMESKLKRAKGDIAKAMKSSVENLDKIGTSKKVTSRRRKRDKWESEPLFQKTKKKKSK